MMRAETAYNVIQALPEEEKARLYSMLRIDQTPVRKPKKVEDEFWTVDQAMEYIVKITASSHNRKSNSDKIKKPETAISSFKHVNNPLNDN